MIKYFAGICTALALSVSAATAATYNEAIDGDLSDDFNAPTVFNLDMGSNALHATVGTSGTDFSDYFALALPSGGMLQQIILTAYDPGPRNSSTTFNDCATGSGCGGNAPGGILTISTLTAGRVGTDFLTDFGGALAGTFMRLGEASGPARVSLDFVVAPVPLPAGLPLLLAGLGAVGFVARKPRF